MTTATRTTKGFAVICPRCGDRESVIMLDLRDLRKVECVECGETYSARQAAHEASENARRWEAVARWVEMAADAMDATDDA